MTSPERGHTAEIEKTFYLGGVVYLAELERPGDTSDSGNLVVKKATVHEVYEKGDNPQVILSLWKDPAGSPEDGGTPEAMIRRFSEILTTGEVLSAVNRDDNPLGLEIDLGAVDMIIRNDPADSILTNQLISYLVNRQMSI